MKTDKMQFHNALRKARQDNLPLAVLLFSTVIGITLMIAHLQGTADRSGYKVLHLSIPYLQSSGQEEVRVTLYSPRTDNEKTVYVSPSSPLFAQGSPFEKTVSVRAAGYKADYCETANPTNFLKSTNKAWLALLLPGVVFTFVGLAIVTDVYFVKSLERIVQVLGVSEDVAGATFMAAGSSAPELFTSLLSVFWTKDDVGVGTIVGSAVFNILIIIGLSAVFARNVLNLDFRPLLRDAVFYIISVVMLMVFVLFSTKGNADWWEGLVLLVGYILYILFMKFGNKPYFKFAAKYGSTTGGTTSKESHSWTNGASHAETISNGEGVTRPVSVAVRAENEEYSTPPPPNVRASGKDISTESSCPGVTTPHLASTSIDESVIKLHTNVYLGVMQNSEGQLLDEKKMTLDAEIAINGGHQAHIFNRSQNDHGDKETLSDDTDTPPLHAMATENEDSEHGRRVFGIPLPGSASEWICFPLAFPWKLAFRFTIVDCTKPKWKDMWLLTFIASIVWIMAISFIMVEASRLSGCFIGVPSSVMGLTVLAAGTSVPDALASVMVVRMGMGDMAVSNAVGSNVFDILVGLGLPWFLGGLILKAPQVITVSPVGLVVIPIAILFAIIIALVLILALLKWKLSRTLGYILFAMYGAFILYSLLDVYVFHIGGTQN